MNNVVYMLCNGLYVGRMNGALVCDNSLLPLETVEKSYEFIRVPIDNPSTLFMILVATGPILSFTLF